MRVQDLDTPVVTIHLDVMEDNIRRVQAHLDRHGIGNRAHIKTHKIPAIGRMQLAGGASGIVCQKIGEVEVFADHGVAPDVLLTYNILGRPKLDRLMAVARRVERLTVVLDNEVVAQGLSEAGARHGLDVRFVVECDTGGARNGVQTPQAAFDLAQAVMKLPHMDFQGLMTFPNKDPDTRVFFERALELFKRAGIPVPIVSGGGHPGALQRREVPDAHRAPRRHLRLQRRGDGPLGHGDLGELCDAGPRNGRQPAQRHTGDPRLRHEGRDVGSVRDAGLRARPRVPGRRDHRTLGGARRGGPVPVPGASSASGEVVNVVPNHCCVVSNMMDELVGVRGDRVEVVWPVAARGRVR